jgi:hypothetical protein
VIVFAVQYTTQTVMSQKNRYLKSPSLLSPNYNSHKTLSIPFIFLLPQISAFESVQLQRRLAIRFIRARLLQLTQHLRVRCGASERDALHYRHDPSDHLSWEQNGALEAAHLREAGVTRHEAYGVESELSCDDGKQQEHKWKAQHSVRAQQHTEQDDKRQTEPQPDPHLQQRFWKHARVSIQSTSERGTVSRKDVD